MAFVFIRFRIYNYIFVSYAMLHKFPFVTLMSYMQRNKLSLNIVHQISCLYVCKSLKSTVLDYQT